MFSQKKKEPTEKPKYGAWVGWGDGSSYYKIYEYRLLDDGVVELRTDGHGKVTLMPGTPCVIEGGGWTE